jgi:alpha-tubulin suppressor-like RCC1 family protein
MRNIGHFSVIATLSACAASSAVGQAGNLQGIVVDSLGKPVARALVFGGNPFRETQTGTNGRFRLEMIAGRSCSLEVIHRGFTVQQRFEYCPDTAIRLVLRPVVRTDHSFDDLRNRCGMRSTEPCTDPDGIPFLAISAGQSHSCGISVDSIAWCWGDGRNGQLGTGRREVVRFPQRVSGDTRFADIATGGSFTCARTAGGQVYCWGNERTVPGWPHQAEGPALVRLPEPATSLAVGRRHACTITTNGTASCWGWNVDGETGIGTSGIAQSIVPYPMPVFTDRRFISLSAGLGFTCGVTTDHSVMCWGSNVDHILGLSAPERCGDVGSVACASRPVDVSIAERIVQLSSGTGHACALSETAAVYCWGANFSGQAGVAGASTLSSPTKLDLRLDDRVVAISSGGIQTCAITSRQLAYCWGADLLSVGQNDVRRERVEPMLAASATRLRRVSVGQAHVCGIDTGGRLRCWGDTILGALGIR